MVSCSYLEIYKEVVRDLLQPSGAKPAGLAIRESASKGVGTGVYVEGLSQVPRLPKRTEPLPAGLAVLAEAISVPRRCSPPIRHYSRAAPRRRTRIWYIKLPPAV